MIGSCLVVWFFLATIKYYFKQSLTLLGALNYSFLLGAVFTVVNLIPSLCESSRAEAAKPPWASSCAGPRGPGPTCYLFSLCFVIERIFRGFSGHFFLALFFCFTHSLVFWAPNRILSVVLFFYHSKESFKVLSSPVDLGICVSRTCLRLVVTLGQRSNILKEIWGSHSPSSSHNFLSFIVDHDDLWCLCGFRY
jgi:hypothetical protein